MVGTDLKGSVPNMPFNTFVASCLPLYSGPEISLRIGSAGHEYKLPKALLCSQVPYFASMFEKKRFIESTEQSIPLTEIDGILSTRSFEMLVQWVCYNRIIFDDLPPVEVITASIEFARLADMYCIPGLDSLMAEFIKEIILANKPAQESVFAIPVDEYTYHLTPGHVESGVQLPKRHPVRKILATAAVKGCHLRDRGSFFQEIQTLPHFSDDLLGELRDALETLEAEKRGMTFEDPFNGKRINLNRAN